MLLSTECTQDIAIRLKTEHSTRTSSITKQEIDEWKEVYNDLKDLDIAAAQAKYEVRFIRGEGDCPPYSESDFGDHFWD